MAYVYKCNSSQPRAVYPDLPIAYRGTAVLGMVGFSGAAGMGR